MSPVGAGHPIWVLGQLRWVFGLPKRVLRIRGGCAGCPQAPSGPPTPFAPHQARGVPAGCCPPAVLSITPGCSEPPLKPSASLPRRSASFPDAQSPCWVLSTPPRCSAPPHGCWPPLPRGRCPRWVLSTLCLQEGGVDSAFRSVRPSAGPGPVRRLYQVKGRKKIRATERDLSWASFNTGDCFVLDLGEVGDPGPGPQTLPAWCQCPVSVWVSVWPWGAISPSGRLSIHSRVLGCPPVLLGVCLSVGVSVRPSRCPRVRRFPSGCSSGCPSVLGGHICLS